MPTLQDFRHAKPAFYPDHAIHAEFACAHFGLTFEPLDGKTGLLFRVASAKASHYFGGGRCSAFPQNNATAATLAGDKYFTQRILEQAGISTLSGEYFFLHERYRAHRPPNHERSDAMTYFNSLSGRAFAKPLYGSRGDFAQPLVSVDALSNYMNRVSEFYDSILLQPIVRGDEYRIFLLDGDEIFTVRKFHPALIGDGVHSLRELLASHDRDLQAHGLSPSGVTLDDVENADDIFPAGQHHVLPGRMNRSAGGEMAFARPHHHDATVTLARRATQALGLRAAAVDLFTDVDGDPAAMAVIEINANPSIRFLEDSGRDDLILTIWRHTFMSIGLLHV
jgi:D-alanine-D-alanine ligase-like ATP-grasp enzyme